ncbi:AAA family ATPase [Pseudogemmobacter sonorensis]|uniref:AAA family ATPase n=1 Tax=Pseudogemmobacter sonorensis TaxID=2989681 RepID=UPI0036D04F4A
MDSISREEGVIVIGACNHPDRIDPAVLRAGRFDLKIEVPIPDAAAILGILQRHLGAAFDAANLCDLARAAVDSSAAEVDAAIRKARATARSEGRDLRPADLQRLLGASDRAGEPGIGVPPCMNAVTRSPAPCWRQARSSGSCSPGTAARPAAALSATRT